jgi:DNA modification methylase
VTPYFEQDGIHLLNGDCRAVMKSLAPESVDSIVTDPPYELGFMGKGWDRSGIAYDLNVWRECLRVLKPGGHLLAFGGPRTYHRLACAIEDAGFEIRDQIQWIYGSGFPKSLDVSKAIDTAAGAVRETVADYSPSNGSGNGFRSGKYAGLIGNGEVTRASSITAPATDAAKQWEGYGTALKPAHEPIVLARKPLIGTVAQNILEHGTGGLNIDGCRIEGESWGSRPAIKLTSKGKQGSGFGQTSWEPIEGQLNVDSGLGRWPANVIHDGSEEVTALFPDVGISSGGGMKDLQGGLFQGTTSPNLTSHCGLGDSGSAARFFYTAKASQDDRNEGLEGLPMLSAGDVTDRVDGSAGLNSPRAGAGRTSGSRNSHPTVKPTELMRYLCRLVTPPNGIVLDPFCGSGSTGKAAFLEHLRFIGIELSADYCEIAKLRIEAVSKQGRLFANAG